MISVCFYMSPRAGQMLAAARALDMDHSTISRRIARLEEKLGVRLFRRAARRISITRDGLRLLSATEKLETIVLRDVIELGEEPNLISGVVRIGTLEGFAANYLAPRLRTLMGANPGLEIELVALPRNYSLAAREVDLAITMDRPNSGSIRFKKLIDFNIGIFGAKSYFEHRKRPASIDDLKEHDWCGYIKQLLFTDELDMLKLGNTIISPRLRTNSVTVQTETILAGSALGVLPCYMGNRHKDLERLLPRVNIERAYWLAVHEDMANVPRVRATMKAIEYSIELDRNYLANGV